MDGNITRNKIRLLTGSDKDKAEVNGYIIFSLKGRKLHHIFTPLN